MTYKFNTGDRVTVLDKPAVVEKNYCSRAAIGKSGEVIETKASPRWPFNDREYRVSFDSIISGQKSWWVLEDALKLEGEIETLENFKKKVYSVALREKKNNPTRWCDEDFNRVITELGLKPVHVDPFKSGTVLKLQGMLYYAIKTNDGTWMVLRTTGDGYIHKCGLEFDKLVEFFVANSATRSDEISVAWMVADDQRQGVYDIPTATLTWEN